MFAKFFSRLCLAKAAVISNFLRMCLPALPSSIEKEMMALTC